MDNMSMKDYRAWLAEQIDRASDGKRNYAGADVYRAIRVAHAKYEAAYSALCEFDRACRASQSTAKQE